MDQLTNEQITILNAVKESADKHITLIDAKAGTGKTYLSYKIVEMLKPQKALYTAFNKAIVEEGKQVFANYNVECRTLHSLAYAYVKPKKQIEAFTYTCITENIPYTHKRIIINALDEFFRSDSLDSSEFINNYIHAAIEKEQYNGFIEASANVHKIAFKLIALANKYLNLMMEEKIPPTFNYLLKWFHYLLAESELDINYDLVLIDEIQDTSGVMLEIFKLLPAKYKVGAGDVDQRLYHFMNLVNGFELLTNAKVYPLTQTFRCSTEIAEQIEQFGKRYLHNSFHFIGIDHPIADGKTAYITSTNAGIVAVINQLHREGKGYVLTRPIKDIFAAPLAVVTASKGKAVYHKQYKFIEDEYKVWREQRIHRTFLVHLLCEVDDEEIHNTVELLQSFNAMRINIFDVLNEAKKVKKNPLITVGTAFSLKGLAFETVHIHSDLNKAVEQIIKKGVHVEEDMVTLRLYYVAASRARRNLHNARWLKKPNIIFIQE